jgi:hypothetical protein
MIKDMEFILEKKVKLTKSLEFPTCYEYYDEGKTHLLTPRDLSELYKNKKLLDLETNEYIVFSQLDKIFN